MKRVAEQQGVVSKRAVLPRPANVVLADQIPSTLARLQLPTYALLLDDKREQVIGDVSVSDLWLNASDQQPEPVHTGSPRPSSLQRRVLEEWLRDETNAVVETLRPASQYFVLTLGGSTEFGWPKLAPESKMIGVLLRAESLSPEILDWPWWILPGENGAFLMTMVALNATAAHQAQRLLDARYPRAAYVVTDDRLEREPVTPTIVRSPTSQALSPYLMPRQEQQQQQPSTVLVVVEEKKAAIPPKAEEVIVKQFDAMEKFLKSICQYQAPHSEWWQKLKSCAFNLAKSYLVTIQRPSIAWEQSEEAVYRWQVIIAAAVLLVYKANSGDEECTAIGPRDFAELLQEQGFTAPGEENQTTADIAWAERELFALADLQSCQVTVRGARSP